jgi:hypothetical protein
VLISRLVGAAALVVAGTVSWAADQDQDGVSDATDNCTVSANPSQLDANADGIGNFCDADLNDSGLVTTADFAIQRLQLGQAAGSGPTAAAADLNGSGFVTTADFGILRGRLGTAPGPYAAPVGLDARPVNTTCIAPPRPVGNATVATVDAFPTLPALTQPVKILQAPGDASRWFVLEKFGRVRVFNVSDPSVVTTWLDFTALVNDSSEGGLLGMAFHPGYPAVPEVFVSYTGDPGSAMVSKVARVILDNVTTPSLITRSC